MSAPTTKSPDLTQGSMRPPSLFTNDSIFADSAISVGGATSPKHIPPHDQFETASTSSEASVPTLSDRLSNLAAGAFAVEEEGLLGSKNQATIRKALKMIEECIQHGRDQTEQELREEDLSRNIDSREEEEVDEEIHLHEIHASLAATVASMRQRQQEQRHLHQLAVQKLEAVAQTCLVQQKQIHDMNREVRELRQENRKLGEENDNLRDHIADIESQATHKDVAVHAMSSAVAGLEGWINNSPAAGSSRVQAARQTPRRGRIVVRGQGRFRGRYFVDDPEGEVVLNGQEIASDDKDIHEGVKSWLKGFRDVEEELQRASPTRVIRSKEIRSNTVSADDEWGEFESVANA